MNDQTGCRREAIIAQFYNRRSTQLPSQQGAAEAVKPKRRRRKVIGGGGEEGSAKKRKLSADQLSFLEMNFGNERKLESERKDRLASKLGLDPRQVAVWFQNRRARWKNKKLEEEYSLLKNAHESALLDKCRLESEIMKLKDQVTEAEKEMQRLSNVASFNNGGSSNSPSSSLSVEALEEAVALGEFGVEGFEEVFYMPVQKNSFNHGMEWMPPPHHLYI